MHGTPVEARVGSIHHGVKRRLVVGRIRAPFVVSCRKVVGHDVLLYGVRDAAASVGNPARKDV